MQYYANQSKRKMDESVKQTTKHQQVSATEEKEQKQFVLQKNGGYALTLLKNKKYGVRMVQGKCVCTFLG